MNKVYIETYGCQMNFADSEIVNSILFDSGYTIIDNHREADVILLNTCSIRDHAEQRVLNRLQEFNHLKRKKSQLIIGIIGCMAERLKEDLIEREQIVDIVAGPDVYKCLPDMINTVLQGQKSINTELSTEETYSDIIPLRVSNNNLSAFISIMRGCENFCAYCVVPYTRGKERSRDIDSIVAEAETLFSEGYREVTLLGQNVNSYKYQDVNFAELMRRVAAVNPLLRVRFATSHPKDLSDELIATIASVDNICKYIHLPVQSGSDAILSKMKRKYDLQWYLNRVDMIKKHIPNCGLSTDVIAGFCDETEEDHQNTLSLLREVGYDAAYMFKYSERSNTFAAKNYLDNVSEDVKLRRLNEIISLQQQLSHQSNLRDIGKTFEILVEGRSKRSDKQYTGRTTTNKVVIFPHTDENIGDYINVKITHCTAVTLFGESYRCTE